ncbi:MAG TPA: MSMEG_0570 family nitrogen starvation response protein [Chthoniobacterales bacterium]
MPEVYFKVQLPDGLTRECYSPSGVVRRYFNPGDEMPMTEFAARSRKALAEASERVRAKFGFACSSAAAQLAEIEEWASAYPGEATMRIIDMSKP